MSLKLDRSRVGAIAREFRLRWGRSPLGGKIGQKLGSGAGASIEFHDYRAYAPGDDIRHIDWKAYARTDALTVRLFREEIAPRVDLLVDESRSMALDEAKWLRLQELALFFGLLAAEARASLRVFASGPPRDLRDPLEMEFSPVARQDPWPPLAGSLRWRSLRIVLSDFLFSREPGALVRTVARDAGLVCLVQISSREEIDPDFQGPLRLVEVEDGEELDLEVGPREVELYKASFARLRDDLQRESLRARAFFCALSAALDLGETLKELARSGIVEAR
ncbi:MAG: DUF58 domain-containing protein [Planctomycetota bacterium]